MADLSLFSPSSSIFTPRTVKAPRLSQMVALWRQRRALAAMDDTQLADIGVTRTQALAEAERPVWDVPCTWRS